MKVALIGDIHANLPALETVLKDAHKREVDAVWNVGDIVGYGAFPEEVVQRLKNDNVMTIIGNYDLKVLKVESRKQQNKKHSRKWFAFNWAYENLSESSREYLSSLPKEIKMEEAGKRILITHGSPESNEEYI
ncbi:YfcE family phosphodiesterase, partial [Candidatus Poribacteria bacterium]|nr:YfcE family phosphodiesterase [Candidatus Poribacteria bacterium]